MDTLKYPKMGIRYFFLCINDGENKSFAQVLSLAGS